MKAIIDYKIRIEGEPPSGSFEYDRPGAPQPGDSFVLLIDEHERVVVAAEVGDTLVHRGRLHVEVEFRDYPTGGRLERSLRWLTSILKDWHRSDQ